MTELVMKNDGTLDKFEGDAVVAFWGAPIPQDDHALRACRCALQMQEALVTIRKEWQAMGRPVLNVRIGINTGEMVVGNMGSPEKFDYTIIGDSVNLASRLEGANKQYRSGILVSERTYDLVRDRIIGRELDLITVQGRTAPLRVFELLEEKSDRVRTSMEFLEAYHDGIGLYRDRKWQEAGRRFSDARKIKPDDYPSQLYIERSMHYAKNPPPQDWDGVFGMKTK